MRVFPFLKTPNGKYFTITPVRFLQVLGALPDVAYICDRMKNSNNPMSRQRIDRLYFSLRHRRPLRSHIMQLFKTLHTGRKVHFFYGARSLVEAFYLEDFAEIEKEFPNFKFHLALDRPDPAADAAGVKYTAGFVHNVMYETYLKDHETPEDIKYFMCGPPMMTKCVNELLDSLGVPPENVLYDNFGG